SALSADLGTVTAGIVQTPDGRAKFGQDALGSGKHGMLVNDGTQDRVAVGNIGGLPWGNGTLPPGTYGFWAQRAGIYLRGFPKVVDYGITPWGGSPTTVWNGVTRVVPPGTRWYVIVSLIEAAVAENVGWTDRDWSLMY